MPSRLSQGTVLQGRYQIVDLIAQGGMGNVYLAQHNRLRKNVAIKELLRVTDTLEKQRLFEEQFHREAQLLAGLDHRNLASVSDYFEERGRHYLVMEYVEGRTLQQVVSLAPRPIAERRVLVWATELLEVLDYLHTLTPPVIVRDLKPDNIMLSSTDRHLRLIDFGIAKTLDPKVGTQPIVKGMGTEAYAPLEQYGGSTTDARSDLYSLGGTLYFLLSGREPVPAWKRGSRGENLVDLRTLNDTVTDRTWSVLLQLMELHPDRRPSSARQVKAALGL
jgi:serine/threonine protein kinase